MNTPFIKNNSIHIGYVLFSLSLVTAYAVYYQYSSNNKNQNTAQSELFKRAHTVYLEGMELYKKGEYDKAIATCEKAIEILPQHGASYDTICLSLIHQGKQDAALECAQKAIAANPNFAPSYLILGQLEFERNNHAAAKQAFEKAVTLDAKLFAGHIFLSQILMEEKSVDS